MRALLMILTAGCLCLVPVMALGENTRPNLELEMYQYDTDPDDPDYGCIALGTCPEICFHSLPSYEPVPCYSVKLPYHVGIVPIHFCGLNRPLAQGWPPPCGPGGGYVAISTGITAGGEHCVFLGFSACPNFVADPCSPPLDIRFSATTACHDGTDHPCYGKWMAMSSVAQSTFTVTGNVNDGNLTKITNCQLGTEFPTIVGSAQWGGIKTIVCYFPTVADLTTWGKIKGMYR